MEDSWGSILPEDLWMRILEIGISSDFSCRDLCTLSLTCKRLNTLSNRHFLWSALLSADFKLADPLPAASSSSSSPSYKVLYRTRYERERDQKRLAHRRVVLMCESEIGVISMKIADSKCQLAREREKMRVALAELLNLQKARQASVALNVWQPEVIRGKQKQMVQQYGVSVNSRISSLDMELRLCKQQIANYDIALKVQKQKLDKAKDKLASLTYHPLQDYSCKGKHSNGRNTRKKKLKRADQLGQDDAHTYAEEHGCLAPNWISECLNNCL